MFKGKVSIVGWFQTLYSPLAQWWRELVILQFDSSMYDSQGKSFNCGLVLDFLLSIGTAVEGKGNTPS